MKIVRQSWDFEESFDGDAMLKKIELAGRTCWKSEGLAGDFEKTKQFVKHIMSKNHMSVIEHASITVRIITDRGVTHEIVRHRLASYSQESTRYCNYSKDKFENEISVILPVWFSADDKETRVIDSGIVDDTEYGVWKAACEASQDYYFALLRRGQTPQQARAVLPNSLKTELVMTANLREWKHFFDLRASAAAHPQMRELAQSMLEGFRKAVPIIFDEVSK